MKNPFELKPFLNRKMHAGKSLSFEEAYLGLEKEDAEIMEDDREEINYRILGTIIFICLSLLFARLFYLQGYKGTTYKALAEGNKLRTQFTLARSEERRVGKECRSRWS